MTPAKYKQKLSGQTTTAQKVFEYIPEDTYISVSEISGAMHRTSSTRVPMAVLKGCVSALHEAKLVRRDNHDCYQRAPVSSGPVVTEKAVVVSKNTDMKTVAFHVVNKAAAKRASPVPRHIPLEAFETAAALTPAPVSVPPPPPAPVVEPVLRTAAEVLSSIALSLRTLAKDLDDAVAILDTATETDPQLLAKMAQVRALFKSQ